MKPSSSSSLGAIWIASSSFIFLFYSFWGWLHVQFVRYGILSWCDLSFENLLLASLYRTTDSKLNFFVICTFLSILNKTQPFIKLNTTYERMNMKHSDSKFTFNSHHSKTISPPRRKWFNSRCLNWKCFTAVAMSCYFFQLMRGYFWFIVLFDSAFRI